MDFYYLRARWYDPQIGEFISEDSIKDGHNWYLYCNNNPVKYIDPSGLVAVNAEEYAKTYEGATTSENKNVLIITYNDKSIKVNKDSKGRYLTDDSNFVNAFGNGPEKLTVYSEVRDKKTYVSIRANFKFSGAYADKKVDVTTYKAAFLKGVKVSWSGSFGDYEVSTYAAESSKGMAVSITNKAGVSSANWGKRTIKMYTKFSNGTNRTAAEFGYTAAYEFGHILGLRDEYKNKASKAADINLIRLNLTMLIKAEFGR